MARDIPSFPGDTSPDDDVSRSEEQATTTSPPEVAIEVAWSSARRAPVSFVWRRRRWRIERVVDTWVVQTGWWSDTERTDRVFRRVRADGRVFDLCHDRIAKAWFLHKVVA
jgi:hypothetical protein